MVYSDNGYIVKRQAWNFFKDIENREGLFEFGFLDGDEYSIDDLGAIGVALHQAVTLKDVIDTFSKLVWDFAEGNVVQLVQGPIKSWLLCYTENQDRTIHAADQHSILILRQVIRCAAGSQWQPDEVKYLSTPMPQFKTMEELSGVRSSFLQECAGVAFHTDLLFKPITKTNSADISNKKVPIIPKPPSTTSSAITSLLEYWLISNQLPTFNEVKEILGTSRMTLYRTLVKENTNYKQLVERVRFKIAHDLLKDPSISLKEISDRLCYSAPSNFSRAFHRMSGVTPANFRKRISDS